jgi:endoglucanase
MSRAELKPVVRLAVAGRIDVKAATVTYAFTLAPGQTLSPSTSRTFAAPMSGNGTAHPTAGDTWTVTYTSGGTTSTLSGTF